MWHFDNVVGFTVNFTTSGLRYMPRVIVPGKLGS
jgi:hypothetical protein